MFAHQMQRGLHLAAGLHPLGILAMLDVSKNLLKRSGGNHI